jgi:Uma2 family endonuclease
MSQRLIDEPVQRLSRTEFRAWADAQPSGRFERHDGIVIAMAPERAAHARLKAQVWRLLHESIVAANLGCEALPDGMTVEIGEDDDFEPDALVHCSLPLAPDATVVPDPVIVVEVLSPSTSATDRTAKLEKYFQLPSVQHYLIVWSDRSRVVHHRRTASGVQTTEHMHGVIVLDPPGLSLDVAALYRAAGGAAPP